MEHRIGVWDRRNPLSKEEIAERQLAFLEYQKQYNETGDKDILWFKMKPLIEDACKSAVIKINGSIGFIPNYEEKVETSVYLIIKRYTKNKDYNFGSLSSLAYYAALYASRNKDIQSADQQVILRDAIAFVDYDRLESVQVSFDESVSQNYTTIDGEKYSVEDLY